MTGTGTQSDPYIVSTWEDFKTAMSTNSSGRTYIELDADIDMNDAAPTGISEITIGNITLDGKNHTIKNLVATGGFLYSNKKNNTAYISNLKILNFVNRGTENFISISEGYNIYFRHCIVSGINASTKKLLYINSYYGSTAIHFSATDEGSCLLNVKIYSGGFAEGYSNRRANIYITDSYVKLSGEEWSDYASWHLDNSYVEGTIAGDEFSNCYNSVIDAECVINSNFTVTNCSNLLVNTDKFTGTLSTESGIKKVTAEQLIDAEYLENIGFPIGVE